MKLPLTICDCGQCGLSLTQINREDTVCSDLIKQKSHQKRSKQKKKKSPVWAGFIEK